MQSRTRSRELPEQPLQVALVQQTGLDTHHRGERTVDAGTRIEPGLVDGTALDAISQRWQPHPRGGIAQPLDPGETPFLADDPVAVQGMEPRKPGVDEPSLSIDRPVAGANRVECSLLALVATHRIVVESNRTAGRGRADRHCQHEEDDRASQRPPIDLTHRVHQAPRHAAPPEPRTPRSRRWSRCLRSGFVPG